MRFAAHSSEHALRAAFPDRILRMTPDGTGIVPHVVDAWISDGPTPVTTGSVHGIACRQGAEGLTGRIDITLDQVSGPATEQATQRLYETLLPAMAELPALRLARLWNYVPAINAAAEDDGGCEDIYQFFNRGRYAALARHWGPDASRWPLPAASAVGCHGRTLSLEFLAVPGAPVFLENRSVQTPPRDYSRSYGPRPPLFCRGVLYAAGGDLIIVSSGTASIIGERSLHAGDLASQLALSIGNLERLVGPDNLRCHDLPHGFTSDGFTLNDLRLLRVYHRHPADRDVLAQSLRGRVPAGCALSLMTADLCRPELLVEVEGVLIAPAPDRAG
jgi:hypothetical protein